MNAAVRGQHGFTLAEIAIALIVLSLLTVFVMDQVGPMLQFQAELATRGKLADLKQALQSAYRDNAASIDNDEQARLVLAAGTIDPAGGDARGRCSSSAATFAPIARYASQSTGAVFRDGGGAPLCVLITPRLTQIIAGVQVSYHSVAFVATGWNNRLDTVAGCGTTGLSAAGVLTVCGDDEGVLIDGLAIAAENFRQSSARMEKIAQAYQSYFQTRFESDPARDVSVDYFASSGTPAQRWDGGGAMPSTGCAGAVPLVAATGVSPHTVLGLSSTDVTDAYGQVIQLDNCSDRTRNPNNATAALQAPPYTALLQTTLPGGALLQLSVVGTF